MGNSNVHVDSGQVDANINYNIPSTNHNALFEGKHDE